MTGGGSESRDEKSAAAARTALDPVHRGVGSLERGSKVRCVEFGKPGGTDGGSDAQLLTVVEDRLPQSFGKVREPVRQAVVGGEDSDELVSAEPSGDIVRPAPGPEPFTGRGKDGVPRVMAVLVVDCLEPIEVCEENRRTRAPADDAVRLPGPAVTGEEPGQRVATNVVQTLVEAARVERPPSCQEQGQEL
ncbi:hypothetical protein GCM10010327_58840 [Streptomyces nitrosporeus]|nr:hypothetical protein GCM10010327_58840 [Streptomyces nitrosporeus]